MFVWYVARGDGGKGDGVVAVGSVADTVCGSSEKRRSNVQPQSFVLAKVVGSLGLRDLPGLTDRGLGAILQCIKRRRKLQSLSLCRSLRFTDGG